MENLELIKLLKTFTRKELREFEKFISSSYHNKGRNLLPYFKVLKKYYPKFRSPKLNRENLFYELYPEKKYDSRALILINKFNSALTLLAKDYLVNKQLKDNPYLTGVLLSESLIKKELFQSALNSIFKTESVLLKDGINNDFFLSINKINNLKAYAFEGLRKMNEYYKVAGELSLTKLMFTTITYFHEHLLHHMVKAETRINPDSLVLIKHLKELNFEDILTSVKLLNPLYSQVFDVYYSLYNAYHHQDNREIFSISMNKIFENLDLFNRTEKYYLLVSLINLCRTTEKLTGQSRITEAYEICKKMIESNAYSYIEDHIDNATFDYIVNHFLRMKKFIETEKFITDFSSKLPELNRQSFVNLAMARLCFARKNYSNGLKYLSKVKKDDVFDLSVKYYTILYYYELGYKKQLKIIVDSFKKLLKSSKKISHLNKERFLRFANVVSLLIEVHPGNSSEKLFSKIDQIIKENPGTFGAQWLTEKVSELSNKPKDYE